MLEAFTKSEPLWNKPNIREIREMEKELEQRKRKEKIMAPLPSIRLKKPLRASCRAAVNFGGQFITKQGRGIPGWNYTVACLHDLRLE